MVEIVLFRNYKFLRFLRKDLKGNLSKMDVFYLKVVRLSMKKFVCNEYWWYKEW